MDNHESKHEAGPGHDTKMPSHAHHFILPSATAHKTFASLLILTGITVGLSYVHLGAMNYVVGMVVAFIKASLVVSIFMNLRKDDRANTVIFLSSIVFLGIFITLTSTDILFRGHVNVDGKPLFLPIAGGPSKFKTPWEPTPEMVAHGKEVFSQQCIACHGPEGKGNGPAAAALIPHPRNFTQDNGEWKNGRRPAQIFRTLKEGIAGGAMASFATLPADDRWSLAHYVASIGPNVLKNDPADLAKVGIDSNKPDSGPAEEKVIPVEVAMKQLVDEAKLEGSTQNVDPSANAGLERYNRRINARSLSNK